MQKPIRCNATDIIWNNTAYYADLNMIEVFHTIGFWYILISYVVIPCILQLKCDYHILHYVCSDSSIVKFIINRCFRMHDIANVSFIINETNRFEHCSIVAQIALHMHILKFKILSHFHQVFIRVDYGEWLILCHDKMPRTAWRHNYMWYELM